MSYELFKFPFSAMASQCELQLYAQSFTAAKPVADAMQAEVARIEAKYSRYRADSIISEINASAGSGRGIKVDAETATLLDYAAAAFTQSAGFFDITSGVLRLAWDFKQKIVPSSSQLRELLPLIGWNRVQWRDATIALPEKGMQLDFGGFGKEYAVDRAVGIGIDLGVISGLVNLGGDVRCFGARHGASAWSVGISHPRKPGAVTAFLPIKSGALATSGDYERYFEAAGERYCHIINPKTGWPAQDLQSVSVFADSCLIAGTLATIAMLMGASRGERFLRDQGVAGMVIDRSGRAITIKGRDLR